MNIDRLNYLFERYESNTASDEELEELFSILGKDSQKEMLLSFLTNSMQNSAPDHSIDTGKWQPVIDKIVRTETSQEQPTVYKLSPRRWSYVAAAAALLFLAGIGAYFFINKKENLEIAQNQAPSNDISAPEASKAYITLADGSRIMLDTASNGELAVQGNAQVVKLDDGQIVYEGKGGRAVYNTLVNPRGSRVVSLTLTDGTKVWLNAGSSITYPTSLSGNERVVEMTGEAYFEVKSRISSVTNTKMPFYVRRNELQVEVLGTHFNVNAYDNESHIRVTLLEGAVQVGSVKSGQKEQLIPGQQAEYKNGVTKVISEVDIHRTMAWKNGYFDFNDVNLRDMMRQLERWYDISVNYQGNIPSIVFKGQMDRNVQLTDVIRFLNAFGIKAELTGRTLTVREN